MQNKKNNSNFTYYKTESSGTKHLNAKDLVNLFLMVFSLMLMITILIIRNVKYELFLDFFGLRFGLYFSLSVFIICLSYQIITKLIKKAK